VAATLCLGLVSSAGAGAGDFWHGKRAHIRIVPNDRTGKIVIHLEEPSGTFSNELALLFAAPVPPSTPMRDSPSTWRRGASTGSATKGC
jgi:peptide/nickel transport system substrate-binding protein